MRLRFQLLVFVLLRTIFNTMHRMVYPFLGVFARGLGVDVTALSLVITGRSAVGAFIPFISSVADQRGRKFGMLAGIALFTLGVGLVALWPSLWTLSLALILALLGKYIFDPAMQAYFGDRVPYGKRGLALSITEFGWSLAFILGIPLVRFLIEKRGWSAPFPVLAVLGIVPRRDANHIPSRDRRANFAAVLRDIPALAAISIALWASAANELVTLVFGIWLEDSFGLRIAALAGASAVIGLSELSGEGLVALVTDRIGKPRALALGLIANIAASLLLPLIGRTEIGALVGLFIFYITFEFILVSHIPMMSEMVPGARATVLSFNVTGHLLGRTLGAFLATFIYQGAGFLFVTLTAVVFNIFGLLALRRLGRDANV
jgi:predicted MFS family arabinose efflux permease